MKRVVLENVDFDKITAKGYTFQIEMTYRAFLRKVDIVDLPIIFYGRNKEKSKMSLEIIMEAFFRVISLVLKRYNLFFTQRH